MRFVATVVGCVALLGASPVLAQSNAAPSEPFKLGTFQIDAALQVGIVLQDRYVIELNRGNEALRVNHCGVRGHRCSARLVTAIWGRSGLVDTRQTD